MIIHPDSQRDPGRRRSSYLKNEWRVLDPSIKADFDALAKLHRGEFYVGTRDRADTNWIVTYQTDDGPVAWYAYNRDTKKAELLFVNQPELAKVRRSRRWSRW